MSWWKRLLDMLKKLFGKKTDPTPDPTPTPNPDPTPTPTPDPDPTPTPDPEPTPTPETKYVVTSDARVEKTLKVPCALSFSMTGKLPSVEDGSSRDGAHLCWAYSKDWNGGNVQLGGGAIVGVRDYCVKSYHTDGSYAGQQRYGFSWDESKTYAVELRLNAEEVELKVDGTLLVSQDVLLPESITVGYGWPPSGRPGCEGATLTNIVWEGEEA